MCDMATTFTLGWTEAKRLVDAGRLDRRYPHDWVEDAFQEATTYYVGRIRRGHVPPAVRPAEGGTPTAGSVARGLIGLTLLRLHSMWRARLREALDDGAVLERRAAPQTVEEQVITTSRLAAVLAAVGREAALRAVGFTNAEVGMIIGISETAAKLRAWRGSRRARAA